MPELSILIPSRNEEWLQDTIDDIFKHSEADIEVIVGFDGYELGNMNYMGDNTKYGKKFKRSQNLKPIGQRMMTNELATLAQGQYIMKLDAHCSMGQGFDRILLESATKDLIQTPILARLHAFDWVCPCGRFRQDVKPNCNHELQKKTVWQIEPKPITKKYCFDTDFIFQYDKETEETGLVETMSLQGSCFMLHRDRYFDLNICDEEVGSWGSQGIETACKGWFNGMRVVTNTDTHYGHLFKNEVEGGGNPNIPPQKDIDKARDMVRNMFKPKDIKWLVEKFNYPADWRKDNVLYSQRQV